MRINKTARIVTVNIIVIFFFVILQAAITGKKALSQEQDNEMTISATKIKDGDDEEKKVVSIEDIEKVRIVSDERIYALIVLWILILLSIFLVLYQSRDDERLYREGYYNRER